MRIVLVFIALALVLPVTVFSRTEQEFRDDIAGRDRQITELRTQVERLRYAAGDGVAHGSFPRAGADHDLLIRIGDEVRSGFETVASDRTSELAEIAMHSRQISDERDEIEKLKIDWAKAIGYAMGAAAVVSALLHYLQVILPSKKAV